MLILFLAFVPHGISAYCFERLESYRIYYNDKKSSLFLLNVKLGLRGSVSFLVIHCQTTRNMCIHLCSNGVIVWTFVRLPTQKLSNKNKFLVKILVFSEKWIVGLLLLSAIDSSIKLEKNNFENYKNEQMRSSLTLFFSLLLFYTNVQKKIKFLYENNNKIGRVREYLIF